MEDEITEKRPAPEVNSSDVEFGKVLMNKDELLLAQLGYKQEFYRKLGFFENWAATFSSMNFISGIPVLFAFAMYTGGPTAAFSNWTMVGGLSTIVSLVMAEIAAALPTAGGIYFWAYRLGGEKWGPSLAWFTAWWNWAGWICVVPGVQQGSTNFLLSALEIKYPNQDIFFKGWFQWLLTAIGMLVAMAPNIISQRILKLYFRGHFASKKDVFNHIVNQINLGDKQTASDGYTWVVGVLFGAWVFYGYDASAHLAEETHDASETVAKGMWISTASAWLLSVPTLILILFCIQDFDGIVAGTLTNNWGIFLVQLIGENGAVAILCLLWVDSTCATASCFMSAQRVTYAIARDGVLPGSKYFRKLSKERMAVNAGFLVCLLSILISCAVIGSTVAFTAITATATICTNFSYLIPIVARHTIGRKRFQPSPTWNLGHFSVYMAIIAGLYITFLFAVLVLPQLYPVTEETLNYAPITIGIVTVISAGGWFLPVWGARHWFEGPKKTIQAAEEQALEIERRNSSIKAAE
ncbi:amino acid or gaba permease [Rhizodiscina lignyota]|uniref:Amino acid or gaba permease n=1 Tax=Rhizodiscina lignyota TaxID=1504668 RepID=A0A9P4I5H2_9PEZI|nr:amino acid or gaba permease [Rhizodiscina lignyota]